LAEVIVESRSAGITDEMRVGVDKIFDWNRGSPGSLIPVYNRPRQSAASSPIIARSTWLDGWDCPGVWFSAWSLFTHFSPWFAESGAPSRAASARPVLSGAPRKPPAASVGVESQSEGKQQGPAVFTGGRPMPGGLQIGPGYSRWPWRLPRAGLRQGRWDIEPLRM